MTALHPRDLGEPIVIYETRFCGFCRMAKGLLRRRGLDFTTVAVDGDQTARRWLETESGQRTIPQIFIHGHPIGGFQELAELDRSGALTEMIAAGP